MNLKTVWEGYKTILDTVRLNQKMEGVYRDTLKKILNLSTLTTENISSKVSAIMKENMVWKTS